MKVTRVVKLGGRRHWRIGPEVGGVGVDVADRLGAAVGEPRAQVIRELEGCERIILAWRWQGHGQTLPDRIDW